MATGNLITPNDLLDLRDAHSGNSISTKDTITFETCVQQCRLWLQKQKTRKLDVDYEEAREIMHADIDSYVHSLTQTVEGYEGNSHLLREHLKNEISDYGVITNLLLHPEVDEVRVNAPNAIFYQRKGRIYPYTLRRFASSEDLRRVVERLLGTEVRLTSHEPFKNSKSIEKWRINAIHPTISAYDEYGLVVRKPKETRLTEIDLIESDAATLNMLSFLQWMPKIYASWVTTGPTGSGKTTLNEVIISNIRETDRLVLVENPNELRVAREHPVSGHIVNDVLQLVAQNPTGDVVDSTFPSMNNLLENSLRQTPTYIGAGEMRTREEFKTFLVAMLTGHQAFGTYHSEGPEKSLKRMLQATISPGDIPELALEDICENLNIIVSCKLYPDIGKRKITHIAEIIGSEGLKPKINIIYEYKRVGVDENGNVESVFIRRNPISPRLVQKFLDAGIPIAKIEPWTRPVENADGDIEKQMIEQPVTPEPLLEEDF